MHLLQAVVVAASLGCTPGTSGYSMDLDSQLFARQVQTLLGGLPPLAGPAPLAEQAHP